MRVITLLSGGRESSGEGHDGVNTGAKACRSVFLFLLQHSGAAEGGRENGMEGGKRKCYENVSTALFMGPVEEHGQRLGHLSQPAHTRLY